MDLLMFQAIWAVLAIILIDIVLAGDNALVIGMAANKLPENQRKSLMPFIGKYDVDSPDEAEKCHFLSFLTRSSNFYWRKERNGENLTAEEKIECTEHLVAKLTSIGYLLHSYKDSSVSKAVIFMDGRQSEVGTSNGRVVPRRGRVVPGRGRVGSNPASRAIS